MILKILIVALGLTLSTYLFKKAAGTLSITKLNIISYTFYLFILQTYIGASLVFLGDKKHYTINYLINEETIPFTFLFVLLTSILLPLMIIITHKVLKTDIKEVYNNYLEKNVTIENEKIIFYIVVSIASLCILMMVLLFFKIGYVPLLKLIHAEAGFNFKTERIIISKTVIINEYIKNILILSFIPVLSYIAFAYAFITKKTRWRAIFIALFISSIFVKTYDFSKAPIVFYLFVFVIIYIFMNNGIKRIYMYAMTIGFAGIIALMYILTGGGVSLDIHNGPISRVIFTQVGTLMYHLDLFPDSVPFLMGRSMSSTITKLMGLNLVHLRSSKIVMAFYGSQHVYEGIAGVMNAFFIGEAYANFGVIGIILSIVYVGILFGLVYYVFAKKIKKSILNVVLFAILTQNLAYSTQGGFFDFIYNSNLILIILLFIFIQYLSKFIYNYTVKKKNNIKEIK